MHRSSLAFGLAILSLSSAAHAAIVGVRSTPPAVVDLTAEGTADWIKWGTDSATDVDRKSAVTPQISNYTVVGSIPGVEQQDDYSATFGWTDGTPSLNGSSNKGVRIGVVGAGLPNNAEGTGFSITAPSDATERVLRFYVKAYNADGTLTATVGGGNGTFAETFETTASDTFLLYTLTYSSPTPETLTVSWVEFQDEGYANNLSIYAATLQAVPEPASLALLGIGGLVMLRRRA